MRRSTSIVLGCVLLATGVLAGRLTSGEARAARTGDARELREELAEVKGALEDMRRSVDRAGGATRTVLVPSAPAAAACPSETKPADEAARLEKQRNHPVWQDAQTLVAAAIDSGKWTASDIMRFRELAREAPEIDMIPLMQRVDAAINSRQLRPDPELNELH
jgi:hypothetical protein